MKYSSEIPDYKPRFPHSVLLQLETSQLLSPSPAYEPELMTPNGAGLHFALASMALSDPDAWQRLQAHLRQIVPAIRRLRHTLPRPNQPTALLFDMVGADALPANQVSEGTLLILGLLTALYAPNHPRLLLLDDLDRGLHPKAQRELIALLRSVLEATPDLQILATTHSPYLLGAMEPEEVRMTYLDNTGSTRCAALASHAKYEYWREEMNPGEMWSIFGEKWIVEQEANA
jgi:predicted ATPase